MVTVSSLLVLLVLLQNGLTQDASEEERFLGSLFKPPKVEVFYNPLDNKSLNLLKTQIHPTIKSILGSHVDLRMYPVAGCEMEENATTENDPLGNATSPVKLVCAGGAKQETTSTEHLCAIDFFKKKTDQRGFLGWGKSTLKNLTIDAVSYLMCAMAKRVIAIPIPQTRCKTVAESVVNYVDRCLIQRKDNLIRWAIDRLRRVNKTHSPIVVVDGDHMKEHEQAEPRFMWAKVCQILGRFAPKSCGNVTRREANDSAAVTLTVPATTATTTAPSSAVYALVMPCLLIMFIAALLF